MNRCGYEQKAAMAAAACEEKRELGMVVMMETVICPKPRRLGALNPSLATTSFIFVPPSPPMHHYLAEADDSKVGAELLDIILSKGGYQVASSPPFYCGSPPSRASNPVIQDAEFGSKNKAVVGASFSPAASPLSPSTSASRGCVRLGQKPATVRIEGFDCLNRDGRQNCRISAVA
ncbi:unnamed protein product [Linum tenue]|uniref:Uncharacterized protein n=1 Tax=Linum tenue TaxID=586396 RepID=A0AAV0J4A0_9ROSI|nr:unnamed protein product [Linum tenue]